METLLTMAMVNALPLFVGIVLWTIPSWIILGRVGMPPALALIAIIPLIGGLIVLFLIAYGRWPHFAPGLSR